MSYTWDIIELIDPVCGPVGVLTWFGASILSCGDGGWGDELAQGLGVTLLLAASTLPIALTIGLAVALLARAENAAGRAIADLYSTIFRSLPELLVLFLTYYGVQQTIEIALGWAKITTLVHITPFVAGVTSLSLISGAYFSELFSGAFRGIPRGQDEAGAALGLSKRKTLWLIIVPQMVKISLPGAVNQWVNILKDTSFVTVIGLNDILRNASIAGKTNNNPFLFFGVGSLLYLITSLVTIIVLEYVMRGRNHEGNNGIGRGH